MEKKCCLVNWQVIDNSKFETEASLQRIPKKRIPKILDALQEINIGVHFLFIFLGSFRKFTVESYLEPSRTSTVQHFMEHFDEIITTHTKNSGAFPSRYS